jgi:hypothetical protein
LLLKKFLQNISNKNGLLFNTFLLKRRPTVILPKLSFESKEVSNLPRASRKARRRKMLQLMKEKKKLRLAITLVTMAVLL